MIARSKTTRIAGLAILALFLLLVFVAIARRWQEQATVLLTWPPFWSCLTAFFAGAGLLFLAFWTLRDWTKATPGQLLALVAAIPFGGVLGVAVLCWSVESLRFRSTMHIEQAEFLVERVVLASRGPSHRSTLFSVISRDRAHGADIPVPRAFFDRLGGYRYNESEQVDDTFEPKCLTLHVQRSGNMIRAVLRGPDGGEYSAVLHECGAGPKAPS